MILGFGGQFDRSAKPSQKPTFSRGLFMDAFWLIRAPTMFHVFVNVR
jgi:hypothetical protein